ncbi:chemotaxis protein CheW [Clostridium rectalis]|uniref:chemotaxis protein CheW n=1 Tax=Clostridium rectalis TaxID=2040295 RepID=UPI000F63861B|nr:chemotaxis protein CheW [Clostridium rectalis]
MDSREIKVLIFSINDEYYATNIMEIERILGYDKPTKVPDSPSFVEGVINYEGNILPVISLAKRFGIAENENKDDAKIIVAKEREMQIGIIVDVVSEVKGIHEEDIENTPDIIASISKRYIKGLIKIDKKIIIFLNLSTILTEEEKKLI